MLEVELGGGDLDERECSVLFHDRDVGSATASDAGAHRDELAIAEDFASTRVGASSVGGGHGHLERATIVIDSAERGAKLHSSSVSVFVALTAASPRLGTE